MLPLEVVRGSPNEPPQTSHRCLLPGHYVVTKYRNIGAMELGIIPELPHTWEADLPCSGRLNTVRIGTQPI